MNKIYFMCSPLGYNRNLVATKTEYIFKIPETEKRLYFNLGNLSRIDIDHYDWGRVSATIDEHISMFPERTLIYYGWEVAEYYHEIRQKFPDAKFFGFFHGEKYNNQMIKDWISNSYDVPRDEAFLRKRMEKHNKLLQDMWNEKTGIIVHEKMCSENRTCFYIR